MKKPIKEDYGYVENNSFDCDQGGWTIEGGEDAYYIAIDIWEYEESIGIYENLNNKS